MSNTVKYKILQVFPADHSISIRYYSDEFPESALVSEYDADGTTPLKCITDIFVQVPIPIPEGAAFEKYIASLAPFAYFNFRAKIIDTNIDTTMDSLVSLINVEKEATLTWIDPWIP